MPGLTVAAWQRSLKLSCSSFQQAQWRCQEKEPLQRFSRRKAWLLPTASLCLYATSRVGLMVMMVQRQGCHPCIRGRSYPWGRRSRSRHIANSCSHSKRYAHFRQHHQQPCQRQAQQHHQRPVQAVRFDDASLMNTAALLMQFADGASEQVAKAQPKAGKDGPKDAVKEEVVKDKPKKNKAAKEGFLRSLCSMATFHLACNT